MTMRRYPSPWINNFILSMDVLDPRGPFNKDTVYANYRVLYGPGDL